MLIRFLARLLYTLIVIIEFFVSLRFIFKLIGASDSNPIVSFVYQVSGIVVDPFTGIVNSPWKLGSFTIEIDSLVVIAVCMLAGFVTMEIMNVFTPRNTARP